MESSPSQFGTVRPGDIKYKDVNGDGRITGDDQVPLAYSNYPLLMYGFGGEFRYKSFTLACLFKGTGNTTYFKVGNGYEMGYVPFHGEKTGNVPVEAGVQANAGLQPGIQEIPLRKTLMQHSLDYPMVRMKIILRNLLSGKTMRAIYVYRKLA